MTVERAGRPSCARLGTLRGLAGWTRETEGGAVATGDALRTHEVVVIKGDGIGPELVDGALVVLEAVERRFGDFHLALDFREGGAGLYVREGFNLAPETMEAIKAAKAKKGKGPKRDGNYNVGE